MGRLATALALILSLTGLGCGSGSARVDAGVDSDASVPPPDSGGCGAATCAAGCCDVEACVSPPTAAQCGLAGAACLDCTADVRADSCTGGACVCAATGARCAAGEFCSASGCSDCEPDCTGKCAGADDGCDGTCPATDCAAGCCDGSGQCVPYGSQSTALCGAEGDACADCAVFGRDCGSATHTCMSSWARDALFVAETVPGKMSAGETTTVSVTMRNIGTATWTAADAFKLGSQNPQDGSTWGTGRVELGGSDSIAPGQAKTFSFQVTAPSSPGVYSFQWRMLKEGVEWFGDFTAYRPVVVGGGSVVVCEALRDLAGTGVDATPALRTCIAGMPAGGILELPAGVYSLNGKIEINQGAITLRTEGKDATMPKCALVEHDCAELRASTSFQDTGGILQVSSPGSVVDHIVINGDKLARAATLSGGQCASMSNSYGYNMRLACSDCTLTNSVTTNALCGTGCEVSGAGSGVIVWRNTIAYNGVHNAQGMWSDGVTVHDYADSTFADNELIDNTDVDLIFGGCQSCMIQDNVIWHTPAFEGGSFAALMIHAWPSGATSGNFTGSQTVGNAIDCGSSRRCGFGLYLGPDAWYQADTYGGAVHHNTVDRAQQGVLIDDVHDMTVYDNRATNPAASTDASCGTRTTHAYSRGNASANIDTSRETLGTTYQSANWDGCIPNWWQ